MKSGKQIILNVRTAFGRRLDVKTVKHGFYNNFLRSKKMASLYSESKMNMLKVQNVSLSADKLEEINERFKTLNENCLFFIRDANGLGILFRSVNNRDVSEYIKETFGFTIDRRDVSFVNCVKKIGIYDIDIKLSSEVNVKMKISVARTIDSAHKQLADLTKNQKNGGESNE